VFHMHPSQSDGAAQDRAIYRRQPPPREVPLKAIGVALMMSVVIYAPNTCAANIRAPQTTDGEGTGFPAWATAPTTTAAIYEATGVVTTLDEVRGTITIDHGSRNAMGFPIVVERRYVVGDKRLFKTVLLGRKVTVWFRRMNVDFELTDVRVETQQ
jgi:Cu/Ag efflux protein CusF